MQLGMVTFPSLLSHVCLVRPCGVCHFGENYLFLPVRKLHLAVSLWMIGCSNAMSHTMLPQQSFHSCITEVFPSIIDQEFWVHQI